MFTILFQVLLFSGAVNAGCSATIRSLSDVVNAVKCTTITLYGFTVPPGKRLNLNLAAGTTVTMNGDISFGNASWAGPLFTVRGTYITFNGNGYKFDGGGPFYWDGRGIDQGSTQKPRPMMDIQMSGTFTNVRVVNSPAHTYSVSNSAALTMSNLVIDNSQGDIPNNKSGGRAAAKNTDGFDVDADNVIIENSRIHNQDDCLAIGQGTNIVFRGNSCTNGHGISIGSINSDAIVSGIVISGNTIIRNDQALRIKTKVDAKRSQVTNITYSGNTAIGMRRFGVLIDQSYPKTLGKPGSGVVLSDIKFEAPVTSITVNSNATQVAVNCGINSCQGTWDWSYLTITGGVSGPVNHGISRSNSSGVT